MATITDGFLEQIATRFAWGGDKPPCSLSRLQAQPSPTEDDLRLFFWKARQGLKVVNEAGGRTTLGDSCRAVAQKYPELAGRVHGLLSRYMVH